MRRHLDFYDFLLWAMSLLLLALTVPVLPRWFDFSWGRKFAVAAMLLIGTAALWAACYRPRLLKDNPTDRIDLRDWFMAASGLFCTVATCRGIIRWSHSGIPLHTVVVVAAFGFISLFAFYCIIDRGGLRKFAILCLYLGGILLLPGLWKVGTGSVSPWFFYITEPKESGYGWLLCAAAFLACGLLAHVLQKRRETGS